MTVKLAHSWQRDHVKDVYAACLFCSSVLMVIFTLVLSRSLNSVDLGWILIFQRRSPCTPFKYRLSTLSQAKCFKAQKWGHSLNSPYCDSQTMSPPPSRYPCHSFSLRSCHLYHLLTLWVTTPSLEASAPGLHGSSVPVLPSRVASKIHVADHLTNNQASCPHVFFIVSNWPLSSPSATHS